MLVATAKLSPSTSITAESLPFYTILFENKGSFHKPLPIFLQLFFAFFSVSSESTHDSRGLRFHEHTKTSRASQQIELELAGVTTGEYELIITFTDINSGQAVQRVERFILEESP